MVTHCQKMRRIKRDSCLDGDSDFAQRLTNNDLGDFCFEGTATLREALEDLPHPKSNKATKQLDYLVPLAATWIDRSGKFFLGWGWEGNQGEPIATVDKRALGLPILAWDMSAGVLFPDDGSGLSKRRWGFWKSRFGEMERGVGELSFVSDLVKTTAGRARERMEKIEAESQRT